MHNSHLPKIDCLVHYQLASLNVLGDVGTGYSGTTSYSVGQSQFLVELKICDDDFARMNELAGKASEGILTPEEAEAVADYLQVGNLLEELKSLARKTL